VTFPQFFHDQPLGFAGQPAPVFDLKAPSPPTTTTMNVSSESNLLTALDELIAQHHLLKHPFYQAWTMGTLPRETLRLYAEQYYQHVRAFPKNLAWVGMRAEGELAALVEENLAEELSPVAPHPQLWRQFAHAVGATDEQLDTAAPLPGFATLLDIFQEFSRNGTLPQVVAAFYAYESQVPEIAGEKIAGLQKFYGITEQPALDYFTVHQEADVRHRAAWREWLEQQSGAADQEILDAAERALKALWGALDAVYPEGCACRN
jgi:pyrroloquinoline-quinone synthase